MKKYFQMLFDNGKNNANNICKDNGNLDNKQKSIPNTYLKSKIKLLDLYHLDVFLVNLELFRLFFN